jgi:hypothetical protein
MKRAGGRPDGRTDGPSLVIGWPFSLKKKNPKKHNFKKIKNKSFVAAMQASQGTRSRLREISFYITWCQRLTQEAQVD